MQDSCAYFKAFFDKASFNSFFVLFLFFYLSDPASFAKFEITNSLYILNQSIGIMVREFTNGTGDLGSIPSRVIPYTQKKELDTALLNTQHYKIQIKGKRSYPLKGIEAFSTPHLVATENGAFGSTSTIYIYNIFIGRVFANVAENQDSVSGRLIPKHQKIVLDASWVNIQRYNVLIKGMRCNPGEVVAPS